MTGKFERAQQYLIPNEDVQLFCQIQSGFLIMSNRRVVILKEKNKSEYHIERAIHYDCIIDFQPKKDDRFEISGFALDRYGCHTTETVSFEVKAPRVVRGEHKDDVNRSFQFTMNQCMDVVEEAKSGFPLPTDCTYLKTMPKSLTHNAILDLNTVLRDRPISDQLVHEAEKFLGTDPFLLEESLREGNNEENGVLFAAGKQGYYLIQGCKTGRFMKNVIVDTVEWDNIRCFVHRWQNDDSRIDATYTLTRDSKAVTIHYLWKPTNDSDSSQYPWLLQPLNGPWILADVMYSCCGKQMPTTCGDS